MVTPANISCGARYVMKPQAGLLPGHKKTVQFMLETKL